MAKGQQLPRIDGTETIQQLRPPNGMAGNITERKQDTAPVADGYVPRRVDVKLPLKHRTILYKKLRILQDSGAKLEDGTEVSDKTKAVLWILENEVAV